jgi:hypothetical protein
VTGFVVHEPVPVPEFTVSVTEYEPVVMTVPVAFSTLTTGWTGIASPVSEIPGDVVKTSWLPPDRTKLALTAEVSPEEVAVKVTEPDPVSLQLANASTPEVADFVVAVHVKVPDDAVNVIEALLLVTVLPPASTTVTTGCVPKLLPLVLGPGEVVNINWFAAPTETVTDDVVDVRDPSVAVIV